MVQYVQAQCTNSNYLQDEHIVTMSMSNNNNNNIALPLDCKLLSGRYILPSCHQYHQRRIRSKYFPIITLAQVRKDLFYWQGTTWRLIFYLLHTFLDFVQRLACFTMRLQKNMAMLIIAFLVGYLPKYVQRAIANQNPA